MNTAVLTRFNPWQTIQRHIVALLEMFNGLAYVFFLLINATLFLRPAEMVPAFQSLPIYEALVAGAAVGALNRMMGKLTWGSLVRQPVTLCVMGVLLAAVLSHLSHFAFWGLQATIPEYVKVLIYYLLLVSLVDTPHRYRGLLYTICFCGTTMVALCAADYAGWHDLQFVEHVVDRDEITEDGEILLVLRMRGTGLFQDPNDISLVIVLMSVLCCYFMMNPKSSPLRFGWLVPLVILAVALTFTRSRGGLLAGGTAGLVYLAYRYGRTTAIVCGLCGALLLPLIAGRQGDIDLNEGTGNDRIQIWREGLEEIKGSSLLFGIGQGNYADFVGIGAHNSYVNSFVELGLFGGTLFWGCFAFSALGLYQLRRAGADVRNSEAARFAPFLAAILAGWCTGLFSLSRCYVVPTYLLIGLGAAYIHIMNSQLSPPRLLVVWNRNHAWLLAVSSAGVFIMLNVFVKVFAS
ncbi:MAG: O-antigen ligase domain-containing protein [Planctomycetales bacterium]|nr:O-antigen ligase domain-containing protein [Planctomycetales bacterium]